MTRHFSSAPYFALCLMAIGAHPSGLAQQPSAIAKDAPYVLRDGAVQVAAARSMESEARAWEQLFSSAHGGARMALAVGDNYSSMSLLTFDRTLAAVMGGEYTKIGLGNNLKIAAEPMAVRVGHAGVNPGAGVPALGIIVNPANPVSSLSLAQLARIFTIGAAGGDLATWGQAGATGELAGRRIVPFGPRSSDYLDSDDPQAGEFLSITKFNGAAMNHTYHELPHYQDIVQRVREDKAAIAIVALNVPLDGVRVVALSSDDGGPAELPSAENISAGRYPLDRFVYVYLHIGKKTPVAAAALDYARTALSDEGQSALAAGGYIPLNATELAEERARLVR